MPRAKRSIQSAITIDGISLIWRLHREQQWFTADGWKGVSIHVMMEKGAHRELYLEYPPVQGPDNSYTRANPPHVGIVPAKVAAHVREAIAAGWDPESRGNPRFYQVSELPG